MSYNFYLENQLFDDNCDYDDCEVIVKSVLYEKARLKCEKKMLVENTG